MRDDESSIMCQAILKLMENALFLVVILVISSLMDDEWELRSESILRNSREISMVWSAVRNLWDWKVESLSLGNSLG